MENVIILGGLLVNLHLLRFDLVFHADEITKVRDIILWPISHSKSCLIIAYFHVTLASILTSTALEFRVPFQ